MGPVAPPLTAPTPDEVRAARERLAGLALRTPLIRLQAEGLEDPVYLKLENLQPIGSFKLRGAGNALRQADPRRLRAGVYTASAGNMAQGVAWCARELAVACTVVLPDHAPATKRQAVARLGAELLAVPFDRWWRVLEEHRFEGSDGSEPGGLFVHPVCDRAVMAGNGTLALEIVEDLPEVETVLVPFGGGGLSCGIAAALRQVAPRARVWGCEVESAAPLCAAWQAGQPVAVPYRPSFVDGIGSRTVLPEMWPLVRELLAGSRVVSLDQVAAAIRHLLERHRVVAEGAGAASVAAALAGFAQGPTVCVVSGGNLDLERLVELLTEEI
jgi:threonine dehydratase